LNKDTNEEGYRTWLQRIDQIIGPRLNRKGIIHTVSYKRAQLVLENSEYRTNMMSHNSKNTKNVVEAFKKSDPPAILVSPSMDTGWDYPNDEVRWMIVGKLPWPDTRPVVMKARKDKDPEYMSYLTMQALVQMSGRAMRHEKDWAEVIVIDDSLGWFLKQHGEFAPKWFREAIRWVSTIPDPISF
jgi:Rad3-related DNA helicase